MTVMQEAIKDRGDDRIGEHRTPVPIKHLRPPRRLERYRAASCHIVLHRAMAAAHPPRDPLEYPNRKPSSGPSQPHRPESSSLAPVWIAPRQASSDSLLVNARTPQLPRGQILVSLGGQFSMSRDTLGPNATGGPTHGPR